MGTSKIEWCEKTWNPVTGCTPTAEGCKNCYAKRMAKRLAGRYGYPADDPFKVTLHPDKLDEPLHWKKPSRVFVCSMGDWMHKDVPDKFINDIIIALWIAGTHQYITLTKRPKRLSQFIIDQHFTNPIKASLLLGFSASTQKEFNGGWQHMAPLATAGWKVIVSLEPLIEAVDLNRVTIRPNGVNDPCTVMGSVLSHDACLFGPLGYTNGRGLSGVIVGGESGPGARPCNIEWIRKIVQQCKAADVPCFVKQAQINGRLSRDPSEWPEDLQDARQWVE